MVIRDSKVADRYIQDANTDAILLVEPYRIKYIPLGLFKLYTYYKYKCKHIDLVLGKHHIGFDAYSTIYISAGEFSYYMDKVLRVIKYYEYEYPNTRIVVGGVLAQGCDKFIKKIIDISKRIDIIASEVPIIDIAVDYTLSKHNLMNFVFTTRGCVMDCSFCYVTTLEPSKHIVDGWQAQILNPNLPIILVHDNNIFAYGAEHFKNVCDMLIQANKKVIFDNGLDCKFWTQDLFTQIKRLSKAGLFCNTSLRAAFDTTETQDGKAQTMIADFKSVMRPNDEVLVYVLCNYLPSIEDVRYRANEVVKAGGWPFLQYYAPLDFTSDPSSYHGENYTPETHIVCDYYNTKAHKTIDYVSYKLSYQGIV